MIGVAGEQRIVIGLLFMLALLLMWSAAVHSPTFDEPAHLVAGLCYWEYGTFDLYRVNPPLARLIGSLPVLGYRPEVNWSFYRFDLPVRKEFLVGRDFVRVNGPATLYYMMLARWACIPWSLLGGYVCYLWSRELWGTAGGLLTLTLWCVFPEVLAHGALFSCDMAAASAGITLLYQFRRWLMLPDRLQTMIAGVLLGFALLTKFTWLLMFGILPACWGLSRLFQRPRLPWRMWFKEGIQLGALLLIGLAVLNLGYGCDGSFRRLKDFDFKSRTLSLRTTDDDELGNRFRGSWLGEIPVPFPRDYVLGCDEQRFDLEWPRLEDRPPEPEPLHMSHYYRLGMAVKIHPGIWILFSLACGSAWRLRLPYRDLLLLTVPAGLLLWTLQSNLGFTTFRYALPVFPPLLIFSGGAAAGRPTFHVWNRGVVTLIAAWCSLSSLAVFPHSLAYVHEFAGGPKTGQQWLSGSGVDYGQDLVFLHNWMRTHPEARPLYLWINSIYDAADLGIDYDCCPDKENGDQEKFPTIGLAPGWYAMGAILLEDRFPQLQIRKCTTKDRNCGDLKLLRSREPAAWAGYSIKIFHVPDREIITEGAAR